MCLKSEIVAKTAASSFYRIKYVDSPVRDLCSNFLLSCHASGKLVQITSHHIYIYCMSECSLDESISRSLFMHQNCIESCSYECMLTGEGLRVRENKGVYSERERERESYTPKAWQIQCVGKNIQLWQKLQHRQVHRRVHR